MSNNGFYFEVNSQMWPQAKECDCGKKMYQKCDAMIIEPLSTNLTKLSDLWYTNLWYIGVVPMC